MINKNFIENLEDLLYELKEKEDLKIENELLKMEKAKYKAYFYGDGGLATKLSKQIEENEDYLIGADGYSWSSVRARARYRTLEDMLHGGIITQKEYNFSLN